MIVSSLGDRDLKRSAYLVPTAPTPNLFVELGVLVAKGDADTISGWRPPVIESQPRRHSF